MVKNSNDFVKLNELDCEKINSMKNLNIKWNVGNILPNWMNR